MSVTAALELGAFKGVSGTAARTTTAGMLSKSPARLCALTKILNLVGLEEVLPGTEDRPEMVCCLSDG